MVPEPSDTFSLVAELAVAFVGFSGIVVVLGQRQSGHLSPSERRRLDNLFGQAFAALIASLFVLTLLHAAIPETIVWRVASGVWGLAAAIMLARDWRRLRALPEPERSLVDRRLVVAIYAAVILTVLLQALNSVHLYALWPLLVAVNLNLLIAFQVFVLLLYTGFRAA